MDHPADQTPTVHSEPENAETPVSPIRVVLFTQSLEAGGAEVQLCALANGLGASVFDVTIVTFRPGGALAADVQRAGLRWLTLDKNGRWDVIGPVYRLIRTVRRLNPDILHAYLGPPNVLAALLKPFFGPARIVWGVRASFIDHRVYDWSWRLTWFLQRVLSRLPSAIVANSHAGRDHLIDSHFAGDRVSVIENGIDTERFAPNPAAGRDRRAEWGIAADAPVFGIVARLDPMKDHASFLEAAALLVRHRPDARFVCVGTGPLDRLNELKALAGSLGLDRHVIWTGLQRDMPAVYNAMDMVAMCSRFGEGFPNAVGEAMACGTVCAVNDIGDAAMIVGDTGFVFDVGDAAALAGIWADWLAAPDERRQARRAAARTRISKAFALTRMIERTAALYASLAGRG